MSVYEPVLLRSAVRGLSSTEFIALGRCENPRWLVPAAYRPDEENFLGWEPYRASSRLAWAVMKAILRWGGSRALATLHGSSIDWAAAFDWRSLGWEKPGAPIPLIYLGTPGESRKAVLHLIDSRSRLCELVVKVPLTDAAARAIANEAAALRELQADGFQLAPRVIAFDPVRGMASQTVVRGARCGLEFTDKVAKLLHLLALPNESIGLREAADALCEQQEQFACEGADRLLIDNALLELREDIELPAYRVHGDFAPWNIKLRPDGSAALVDWEDARPRGLPFHDAFHFVHTRQFLFARRPEPAFSSIRFRTAAPMNRSLLRKLELAYLVDALSQRLAQQQTKHANFLLATLRMAMAAHP